MLSKTEISRFDYVLQTNGLWDWCIEVRVTQADTFTESGTRTDTYGPMPPSQAEAKFGLRLDDVIVTLNTVVEAAQDALTAAQEANAAIGETLAANSAA